MPVLIQFRRDSAANWNSANPTLAEGEVGLELDTGQLKIGNGSTSWANLSYFSGGTDFSSVSSNIVPSADSVYNLGSPTKLWKHIYTSGGSIYLDDIKLTNEGGKLGVTKVVNPGSSTEAPDPTDSDALAGVVSMLSNNGHELALTANGTVTLNGNLFSTGTNSSNTSSFINGNNIFSLGEFTNSRLTLNVDGTDRALFQMQGDNTTFLIDSLTGNVQITAVDNVDWYFKSDGKLQLPSNGDIIDYNGQSVLGGGAPSIADTKRGFINLVGDRPNNEDDIWFESVVVRGDYAYVLGGDWYISNSNERSKVYKFDLRSGEQVWVRQIAAGRDASFNLTFGNGIITLDSITSGGTAYKAGEQINFGGFTIGGSAPLNNFAIEVGTIDGNGAVLTANIVAGYNISSLSGTASNLVSSSNDITGDTATIGYDDFLNKIVVVSEYATGLGDDIDNYWTWTNIYLVDPVTGDIDQTVTLSDQGDIFPNSISTRNAAGNVAIVGEKYNEYRNFGNLTILAGYNDYFDILKSDLDPEYYPGAPFTNVYEFWISGTGISGYNNVDGVNYYDNLTGNVRQGSGAVFDITDFGDTTFSANVVSGGTDYLVGHKIKILGTELGGTSPTNDAILTVDTVASGSITSVNISGTAAGNTLITYSNVSGTNYQVGSGALFNIEANVTTGVFTNVGWNNSGSNYVIGDIITVPGTNFANGTSPTNDFVVNVTAVSGGSIDTVTVSGSAPDDTLHIRVIGADFSGPGTWTMRQNLGGEAFIWTPSWTNAIGGPSGDRFYDVCWKADGTALYAVGRGRYDVDHDQALVVKFDAVTGAVVWSKDIKFTEAALENREARAVCLVPGSTDIFVAGGWYNPANGQDELILTRMTDAGAAVWQKIYSVIGNGVSRDIDFEINLKTSGNVLVVSYQQSTADNRGLAYLQIDPANGTVIRHRVLSADGNSNYNYYNTPTANFADIYTDSHGDHIVVAGFTYVPTDNYYNALLYRLPLDGYRNLELNEKVSIGEHILTTHQVTGYTVTSAFESFIPTEHVNTITNSFDQRDYHTRTPDGNLHVWTHTITDDSAGYLEFGDGSKQSFATNIIPQVTAANDYYLDIQDSGKHIFFENENGVVYIPHREGRYFPVGFAFTIVNTTNNDCWVRTMTGSTSRARLKLAGRNIDTVDVGIPDSGSGSMVTVMKIKDGYAMANSDGLGDYPDIWMISGPGDVYDND